jgi:hypothetical protein
MRECGSECDSGLKIRSWLIVFCLCLAFVPACVRPSESPDLTLIPEVSPQPPRVGQVTIVLRLTDASGKPVSGARLALEGNMSHAGMAPVFANAVELGAGRYQAIVDLPMAGDWSVAVHLTLADGRQFDRQFEIKGVAAAS